MEYADLVDYGESGDEMETGAAGSAVVPTLAATAVSAAGPSAGVEVRPAVKGRELAAGASVLVSDASTQLKGRAGARPADSASTARTVSDSLMPAVSTRSQARRAAASVFEVPAEEPAQAPDLVEANPPRVPDIMAAAPPENAMIEDPRDAPVGVPALNRTFPAPSDYDAVDTLATDRTTLRAMAEAPWFQKAAVLHEPADGEEDFFARYLDEDGYLPGQIPREALDTWVWRRAFCVRDNELRRVQDTLPVTLRGDFAHLCSEGLRRLLRVDPLDAERGVDMFVHRTLGEENYLVSLLELPEGVIDSWRGVHGVRQEALRFVKPLLRMEFRYLTKAGDYWLNQVADERRFRTWYGQAVPAHCPQVELMTRECRRRAFPRFPDHWQRLEVPQGCLVEMPPVFSYKPSALLARDSGWWVVAYTEFVARAAAYILGEVYDSMRLWWVSTEMIAAMRALNLEFVLGNRANVEELYALLDVIAATDFRAHPAAMSLRYAYGNHNGGRWDEGADYVHFDPWAGRVITPREYETLRVRGRRQMPTGHPRGIDFFTPVEGWDGRRYTPPDAGEGGRWVEEYRPEPVDFLGDEVQRNAKPGTHVVQAYAAAEGAYYAVSAVAASPRREGGGRENDGGSPAPASPAPAVERGAEVREFLREAGVDERHLTSWDAMLGYIRGRCNL